MKRTLVALLAALALSGVAALSWAGGSHHRHSGDPLAVLTGLQAQLQLNTSQQLQFDNALALSKSSHEATRSAFAQLKAATQAQLAKPAPDLGSLATLSDQVQQQSSALHKQARAAWLALYDNLSADQKLVVRDAISAGIERAAAMHEKMRAAREQ